jgi:hypothetical protein
MSVNGWHELFALLSYTRKTGGPVERQQLSGLTPVCYEFPSGLLFPLSVMLVNGWHELCQSHSCIMCSIGELIERQERSCSTPVCCGCTSGWLSRYRDVSRWHELVALHRCRRNIDCRCALLESVQLTLAVRLIAHSASIFSLMQARVQQACAGTGHCPAGLIRNMQSFAYAMDWVRKQLDQLTQHPDAAAAVKVHPGLLVELSKLGENIAPKFRELLQFCNLVQEVEVPAVAEIAVYAKFLQGSVEGWLHEGMQQLGAQVWAAWPQSYACNDDRCMEMGGLTEHSCISSGRQRCSGCRVSCG